MATLTITFNPPASHPAGGYRLRYRVKDSGLPYTIVLLPTGANSYTVENVPSKSDLEGSLEAICTGNIYSPALYWSVLGKDWVEDTYTCEQGVLFQVASEFTGFASPVTMFYDETLNRFWVGDQGDTTSNIYWIDPTTFTGTAGRNYITMTAQQFYNIRMDKEKRRIYMIGQNSGGMLVYDIDTNTFSTVAFGVDGVAFNRLNLRVIGDKIYTGDNKQGRFVIIDRNTLAVLNNITITTIPSYSGRFNDYDVFEINNEVWVTTVYNTIAGIIIYNSTMTSVIGTITLPGAVGENGGSYFREYSYHDADNNRLYMGDAGGKKLYIIDTSTKTVVNTKTHTLTFSKTNVISAAVPDPVTSDLYVSVQGYNSPSEDAATRGNKTYKINRTTYEFEKVFPNNFFSQLTHQPGSNFVWGTTPGLNPWDGGAWATDGKIIKYNR